MIENNNNYLNSNGDNLNEDNLILRYESMIANNTVCYFDVDEFEDILEYYMQQQQTSKALEVISFAHQQHPATLSLQLKKAELLINDVQFEEAIKLLNNLIGIESAHAEVWILKGIILVLKKEYNKAQVYFEVALKKDDHNTEDTLLRIGMIFSQQLQYDLAYPYLQNAYELNPRNKDIIFELAYCCDKLFYEDEAISLYKKYIDIDPFSDSAWYNLGIIYNRKAAYTEAIDAYEFAIAINPKHSNAYFNMGNSSVQLGRYENAIKFYHYSLELEEHTITYTNIGECFEKLNDFDQAMQYYEKAIKIDETVPEPWFGTGCALMFQDKMDEAKIYLEKACDLAPNNPDYWYALGSVYATLDMNKETVNAFTKAIDICPDDPTFAITFAEFYHQNNQLNTAIETLENSLQFNEESPALWSNLAAYNILINNTEAAELYIKKSINSTEFSLQHIYEQFPELKIHSGFQDLIQKWNPEMK